MSKQQKKPNFMVYSIILPDLVKEQAKIISQYNMKKQANESLPLKENELIELFEHLFNNKTYNNSFEIIGSGSYGIVLATKNMKRGQDIVLKIQIVEDKTLIDNEIKAIKKIQMSLIVKFYDHYFIKGQNNKTYVVYEFERCSCDFGLSIQLNGNQPYITENSIGTPLFQAPEILKNDKNKMYSKKSDIFSTGLILCLVDNYLTLNQNYAFAFSNMIYSQFSKPFDPQFQVIKQDYLNRQSQIYKYIEAFVVLEIQKRKDFTEFINQNPKLYFLSDVELQTFLSQQNQRSNQLQIVGESQIQQNGFNDKTFQNKQKNFTQSEKAKLIDIINKRYENVIIISQQGQSLILGVFNKVKNRESVLKIQKVKSKSQVIRQASIMRTKMPLIIELHEYYYLTLTQKDDFVVYELEKCSCDLRSYLERYKSNGIKLSEKEIGIIAQQMIDSINFLHKINMIHQDIRLEKFLVQENKSNNSLSYLRIKLTAFNLAQPIRTDNEYDDDIEYYVDVQCPVYSERYRAPEQIRKYYSSKETDIFSLGISLCLLDNYDQLMPVYENQFTKIQIQFEQPFSPLKNESDLINRKTAIYLNAIKNTLVYESSHRKDLSKILQDFKQNFYSQEVQKIDQFEDQNSRIFTLNYQENKLGAEGAKNIGMSLEKCQNITSLNLNLWQFSQIFI
ncbi:hypothetical protein ABPG72_019004 [Tetrahymena utriculariae]